VYGPEEFSKDAIGLFGKDVPFIIEDENLLHPQMGFLASAIEDGSTRTEEILAFIEELLGRDDLDSEIQNAVVISFVELEKFKELQIRVPPRIERILTKY
jgi:hypothetical protein